MEKIWRNINNKVILKLSLNEILLKYWFMILNFLTLERTYPFTAPVPGERTMAEVAGG